MTRYNPTHSQLGKAVIWLGEDLYTQNQIQVSVRHFLWIDNTNIDFYIFLLFHILILILLKQEFVRHLQIAKFWEIMCNAKQHLSLVCDLKQYETTVIVIRISTK